MRSDLIRGVRPMAAVLLLVLAIAASFVGLTKGYPASAVAPGECETAAPTGTTGPSEPATSLAPAEESTPTTECETESPAPTAPTTSTPGTPGTSEPTAQPTEVEPTQPTAGPSESDAFEVSNARFRWGINNQSNARSHNPGAYNFFSAGVANPGQGGVHLQRKHWSATDGNVTIQRWLGAGKGWGTAVWDGWKKTASGAATGMDSDFSLHNVLIKNGTGSVDLGDGTARIAWRGTFTVVYYSGNTLFTVSDPVLTVRDGKGTVTAVLGGWASDRGTMSEWEPVAPKRATIASLPKVALNKSGFSVTPTYRGVTARGFSDQVTDGVWGAFPQSMLDFLRPLAIAQFWYSTGLSTDDTKVPLPLTVSFTAKEVTAPVPTPEEPKPTVRNSLNSPPALVAPPRPGAPAPQVGPVAPQAAQSPTPPAAMLAADDLTASRPVAATTTSADATDGRIWWIGGGLLFVAALTLLIPAPAGRRP